MSTSPYASLVIILKRPKLYQGKQRIAAVIGAKSALVIAEHLLECVIEDANSWPGLVIIAPSSAADQCWAEQLLSRPALIIPQPQGTLGNRIQFIDQQLDNWGFSPRIYIGSDAPCMNMELLLQVNVALTVTDVVLSPARDGGVTLMATRNPWLVLSNLPWSTDKFYTALTDDCIRGGYSVKSLSGSYDVDLVSDLYFAYTDLTHDLRLSRQALRIAIKGILMERNCSDA